MKKTMSFKRIWSFFALVALLVSMFAFTASAQSSNVSEIGRQSVVMVSAVSGGAAGSGFAIGTRNGVDYIITAYSAVAPNTTSQAYVYLNLATNPGGYLSTIVDYDPDLDLALLRLPEGISGEYNELVPVTFADLDSVSKGDSAFIIGYPAISPTLTPSSICPYPVDIINAYAPTSGTSATKPIMRTVHQYTATLNPSSTVGGPVVNTDGQVIGVNVPSSPNQFVLSAEHIIDMCEKNGIDIKVGAGFPWLIVIIVGGVLLVAVIVLVIVLILRKGKKAPAVNPGPVTMPLEPDPAGTGAAPMTPAAPTARLIAIGGYLNGKKYNLAGSVRIGRNAAVCGVSYPTSTQGVSGVHCEVTFDGNVCYVKDLGSSYGTFTSAGVKLKKDVPVMLRSGDKFYLASPDNTFEIRF
ncbi:MAG: FHA domain-containing protein [Ruminococcaceae bacterium]|nr:FHA domain-containing protein [Oscillospiraceae bacterium]